MEQNYDYKPNKKKGDLVIVSASRRTDMPQWYAQDLIKQLNEKYPPEVVHSIVLWTKFPRSILREPLKSVLSKYKQVFVNLTITGLGGSKIEKNVPKWEDSVEALPELIKFVGNPKRIRLRIDPISVLKDTEGKLITNSQTVKEIVTKCSELGITEYVTSFLVPYGKVLQRLEANGLSAVKYSEEKKFEYFKKLKNFVNEHGGELYACSVPGLPRTACVDGELLQKLHPDKAPCSIYRPKTREDCNCSHSIDLGWYTNRCLSGCLYCYANTEV